MKRHWIWVGFILSLTIGILGCSAKTGATQLPATESQPEGSENEKAGA